MHAGRYTPKKAGEVRDSVSKAVYSKMFSWLVKRIDAILAADRPTVPSGLGMKPTSQFGIGILDIFGFEDFKINGFDQLLINLANENLHHFFNNHIFVQELVEFEKEEIDLSLYEGIKYEPFTLAPRRSVARHVYPRRPCQGRSMGGFSPHFMRHYMD
jgi:myosin heavy subunit